MQLVDVVTKTEVSYLKNGYGAKNVLAQQQRNALNIVQVKVIIF